MKKLLLLMVVLPQFAWAAPHEFLYQAEEGSHTVVPTIDTNFGSTKTTPTGATEVSTSTQTLGLGVEYQYGFHTNHSVGAQVGFSTFTSETDGVTTKTEASGINDINVVFRGRLPFEDTTSTLRYGADMNLGLGNVKLDTNGNPENRSAGRTTMTPYIGWDYGMMQNKHVIGGRLSQQFAVTDGTTETSTGTTSDFTGAESTLVEAYYEMDQETWKFVGIVGYQAISDTTTTVANVSTVSTNPTWLNLTGRFPIYLNENSTVLPAIAYRTLLDDNNTANEITNNEFLISGSYRFLF